VHCKAQNKQVNQPCLNFIIIFIQFLKKKKNGRVTCLPVFTRSVGLSSPTHFATSIYIQLRENLNQNWTIPFWNL